MLSSAVGETCVRYTAATAIRMTPQADTPRTTSSPQRTLLACAGSVKMMMRMMRMMNPLMVHLLSEAPCFASCYLPVLTVQQSSGLRCGCSPPGGARSGGLQRYRVRVRRHIQRENAHHDGCYGARCVLWFWVTRQLEGVWFGLGSRGNLRVCDLVWGHEAA
jgi:hypothetical protein